MYGLVFIMAYICVGIGFGVSLMIERYNRRIVGTSAGAAHLDDTSGELNSEIETEIIQELEAEPVQ